MIEVLETNLKDTQMQSSKGNQRKWEKDGIPLYTDKEKQRIRMILYQQMRKYKYLFF